MKAVFGSLYNIVLIRYSTYKYRVGKKNSLRVFHTTLQKNVNEILANTILPELLRVWPRICPQIILYSVMDLEIAYVGTEEQVE